MNAAARNSLVGAGLGAGLMFLLDPARGSRRRALIRDKMIFAARKTRDAAGATRRDLGNRLYGLNARARSAFAADNADDRIIRDRVRAELGRIASHPRAICVDSHDRRVALSGDVLASEVPSILSAVKSVHGVEEVDNLMTAHASAAGIPSLQGYSQRPGQWRTWLREGWSPTAMVLSGAATAAIGAIAFSGSRRSG
jgi:hypothetical protein